ncbi:MAG: Gfo/Idh/MocA family oxidoreductase [Kiritimatiellaeota bacterium]|nr:Gfo/Idh/MocA family oxidoreductase [Kiritimatiellota bacterium]
MLATRTIHRRDFIKAAAGAAAFSFVPAHVLGAHGQTSPSEKLNIAGIGLGGMGYGDLQNFAGENIVALCDADQNYAAAAFKEHPDAKVYTDYREMLDKQKDLEAVFIATPDHTHAAIAAAAMRAGKHVYCQKPLTHDVYEARTLARLARETKVCTQMGIQHHSGEGIRLVREWIEAGVIGAVREVVAWSTLTYYPAGHVWWSPACLRRPTDTPAAPAGLNWDVWIGPAPMRPYHPAYHPKTWRAWWDFGSGMMGDRGVHTLDSVVWSLKLGLPESVEATSFDRNPDTHPLAAVVTFQFAAREKLPPVKVTWYEGLRPPRPTELEDGRTLGDAEGGLLFYGSKGTIMSDYTASRPRLIPESKMKEFGASRPPKTLPRVPGGHYQEWVRACKGDRKTGASFDYGSYLTEICQLGNIAKRVDGRIMWDAANMRVTNNEAANQYVKTPYREGWSL